MLETPAAADNPADASGLDFTGERYVPTIGGELRHEHLHRYALATAWVRGKQVLDVACGEGYGSALLAAHADAVIGVDISAEAVAHARARYGSHAGLRFEAGDATRLPLPDRCVDVVVSFETIEHLEAQDEMLRECRRVLRPGGLLVISSPNRPVYAEGRREPNHFHVRELDFDEFDTLLRRHFRRVRHLAQRLATGSAIWPLDGAEADAADTATLWADDGSTTRQRCARLQAPMYFVALASNGRALPAAPPSWLVSEAEDLYAGFRKVAQWASGVHDELMAERAAATARQAGLARQLAEAERHAEQVAAERTLLESEADQLRTQYQLLRDDAQAAQAELTRVLAAQQAASASALAESTAALAATEQRLQASEAELAQVRQGQADLSAELERQAAGSAEALRQQAEAAERALRDSRAAADQALAELVATSAQRLEAAAQQLLELRAQHADELRTMAQSHEERLRLEAQALQARYQEERQTSAAALEAVHARHAAERAAQAELLRARDAEATAREQALARELAQARAALAQAQGAQAERDEQHAGEVAALRQDLQALRAQAAAERESAAASWQARHDAGLRELAELRAAMAAAAEAARAELTAALTEANSAHERQRSTEREHERERGEAELARANEALRQLREQLTAQAAEHAAAQAQAHAALDAAAAEAARASATADRLRRDMARIEAAGRGEVARQLLAQRRMQRQHRAELAAQGASAQTLQADLQAQLASQRAATAAAAEAARRALEGVTAQAAAAEQAAQAREAQLQAALHDLQSQLAALPSRQAADLQEAWGRWRAEWAAEREVLQQELAQAHESLTAARLDTAARVAGAEARGRDALEAARSAAEARDARMGAQLLYRMELAAALARGVIGITGTSGWALTQPLRRVGRWIQPDPGAVDPPRLLALAREALYQPSDTVLALQSPGKILPSATPDMNTKLQLSLSRVRTVDELLDLDDENFVDTAYLALLGRPADPEGRRHYLEALAGGEPRLKVLHDIHRSAEGRGRKVPLQGFDDAMRSLRRSRLPVVGRLFKPPAHTTAVATVQRSVEGLAEHVIGTDQRVEARLATIERALEACVQGMAEYVQGQDRRLQTRVDGIEQALALQVGRVEATLQAGFRGILDGVQASEQRLAERVSGVEQALAATAQGLAGQVAHVGSHLDSRLAHAEADASARGQQLAETLAEAQRDSAAQLAQRVAALVDHVDGGQQQLATELQRGTGDLQQRLADLERRWQSGNEGLAEYTGHLERQIDERMQTVVMAGEMARHRWSEDTDLWQSAKRLLGGAQPVFVRNLFLILLGREPQAHESAFFLELLGRGASRAVVLQKLLRSPEFLHDHPLLLAPAAPATPPVAVPPPPPRVDATALGLPSIPIHAQPVVSVIIPVYGKLEYTLLCLRSIAAHAPKLPFEVIVVDDCSPDDSAAVLARVAGIRFERNPQNLGFIRSCNRGAALARGEYLCFLNNDTEVAPRWLDELHATFDLFPGTGLAGSKLLFPDGSLQEAGGIIWRDGSAWNFGRGQDPRLPVFNYAREVDYCSGASIMVPKALFDSLGGFDEHYLPAYCEDSDLALKVRSAGLRVIYQPLSEVVHHEGITSGTDTGGGVKAYQVVNSRKLFERWQQHLQRHQPGGTEVDRAKDRMAERRVLVIDQCTPTPNQDAGSVTVVNFLTLLREMRFQVTFIPEDNLLYMPDYTVPLQRGGTEVLYTPYTTSVEQHLAEFGGRYDLVLLWRPAVVEKHLDAVRRLAPRAKVIYHTVDLHYLRMEREAELRDDAAGRAAAAAMKARELSGIRAVDSAIVHSTHEVEVLAQEIPTDNVFVFPLIMNVPGSRVPFAARSGVAFVGGYQHPPNVDAVLYFAREVMPLLRQRLPGAHFVVIGSKPPPPVLALAAPDIEVVGFVEELQPVLDRVRVSVAPLRYGAGIKGKVGNSMAMGLPVVATSVAVEGMQLEPGRHLMVGDDAAGLADAIVAVHEDEALWRRLQAEGIARVEALWGAQASYDTLQKQLAGLGIAAPAATHPLRLYRDGQP